MFDHSKLAEVIKAYKDVFVSEQWNNEKYKWEAVQHFQKNWNENASDFAEMLNRSLDKTGNLLASYNNFPKGMIVELAKAFPEKVKAMFKDLFDETKDIIVRIDAFKSHSETLFDSYKKTKDKAKQHYQNENAITTYLWLRFPDKYFIYKYTEVKAVAQVLDYDYSFKKGKYEDNTREFLNFYNEIRLELKKDNDLVNLLHSQITDGYYLDSELYTLTIDVGYFISNIYAKEKIDGSTTKIESCNYWWLNANPMIWHFSDLAVNEVQSYTLVNDNGHKRRIYQNFLDAKAGDLVIGYESTPVKQIVAIARVSKEQNGSEIFFEKLESLTNPISYSTLKDFPELENMEYFKTSQGSLFKLTKEEYDFILDLIREENPIQKKDTTKLYSKENFLKDVYMPSQNYDKLVGILRYKKNLILQGAPGVGKTFAAKRLAWSMMGKDDNSHIEFVQFHQNYSYEDFMMGYKPYENTFRLEKGVFYSFCKKAADYPKEDFFFIIDEINRGNMSKIFGELLMLIEEDHRGEKITLAYNEGEQFAVPKNLYIIGMMNTADRSLAMIDYALRRRFSFFEMGAAFDTKQFNDYVNSLKDDKKTLIKLIDKVKDLNKEITTDLGKGFIIGHSYFCGLEKDCSEERLRAIVDYDILPMLKEYWFDENDKVKKWQDKFEGVFNDKG